MYSSYPSLVCGFHGCDRRLAEEVFAGRERLKPSENEYDWLGHGVYFWEHNPLRALEYARHCKESPRHGKSRIEEEAVIGAVIDLGYCFNLLESDSLAILSEGYQILHDACAESEVDLPQNRPVGEERDLLLRPLDCAVIQTVHAFRDEKGQRPYDSVRGVFWEGKDLYPNAGFKEKNHIQMCVRNLNCIKGYFRPLDPVDGHIIP